MKAASLTGNVCRCVAALLVALLHLSPVAAQEFHLPVQEPIFELSSAKLMNNGRDSGLANRRNPAVWPERIPLGAAPKQVHALPKVPPVDDPEANGSSSIGTAVAETDEQPSQLKTAVYQNSVGQPADRFPSSHGVVARPEFPQPLAQASNEPPGLSYESNVPMSGDPISGDPGIVELGLVSEGCVAGCEPTQLHGRTRFGRFLNGIYQGVCCPDPCYQPTWTMLANASLFTDALRPQHRQRFRWEFSNDYRLPDRAEYLWGQSDVKGPGFENSIDFHELSYYVETGGDKFAFFVKTPYRSNYFESDTHTAGFADLTTGTKTLLHDSELLQIGLQFETHIPSANPLEGLGTGHVALEPSLLFGLQLSQRSYLQTQISEWIPIGGTPNFQGALLKYSASYNRTLLGTVDDTSLIGTLEYSGVSFQAGSVTTAVGVTELTSEVNFGRLGGGLRLNICNKFDIGFAAQFGLNDVSPSTVYRTEIQFRH